MTGSPEGNFRDMCKIVFSYAELITKRYVPQIKCQLDELGWGYLGSSGLSQIPYHPLVKIFSTNL